MREPVAVVTVSYNTRELTALLLWSLYRVLDWPLGDVVVVDNASTDGSLDMLRDAQAAGLVTLLANDRNVGHGLALNQAVDWLRGRARRAWILDSDCVVARPDALAEATRSSAAIVGEPHWDPWRQRERFETYSLLLDLEQVAHPFAAGGDPSLELLDSARDAGLELSPFPFTEDGFVIHLGRGSLAAVVQAADREHELYAWAVDHHEPHYGGVAGAAERYAELVERYRREGGSASGGERL